LVQSKRGVKYVLDRSVWSTYRNFDDIYSHIYDEVEDAEVATRLDESVWVNRAGNIVEEGHALGCKVTHDITRPDICVDGDNLGGNIRMKGNGHSGGALLLCKSGTIPQQNVSTRDKNFTLLPLTLLTGELLMCVLIIAGFKPSAATKMGIDPCEEMVDQHGDMNFCENNYGKGNYFLAGQPVL